MNGSKNNQNSKSIIYMYENFKEPIKEYNSGHSGAPTSNPSGGGEWKESESRIQGHPSLYEI